MKVFFTSDLHFGHANIIKYCNRPFKTTQEMDDLLISKWNTVVTPDDYVYVVGDFAFNRGKNNYIQLLTRLNGTKILIVGNHDKNLSRSQALRFGFAAICYSLEYVIHGIALRLQHRPRRLNWYERWFGLRDKKLWVIHGHTHRQANPVNYKTQAINVCTDMWAYTPVPEDQIFSYINKLR
jgi:calcineurin-like phosphoesterase family protein